MQTPPDFQKCLMFVENTFPSEVTETHYKQAMAVQAISQVFFEIIIPKVLAQNLAFCEN